jgi:hypothetical protein
VRWAPGWQGACGLLACGSRRHLQQQVGCCQRSVHIVSTDAVHAYCRLHSTSLRVASCCCMWAWPGLAIGQIQPPCGLFSSAAGDAPAPGDLRGVMPLRVRTGEQAASGARGDLNSRGGDRSCWRAIASAGLGDGSGVTSLNGLHSTEASAVVGWSAAT